MYGSGMGGEEVTTLYHLYLSLTTAAVVAVVGMPEDTP
jgi:hypothetical protein